MEFVDSFAFASVFMLLQGFSRKVQTCCVVVGGIEVDQLVHGLIVLPSGGVAPPQGIFRTKDVANCSRNKIGKAHGWTPSIACPGDVVESSQRIGMGRC